MNNKFLYLCSQLDIINSKIKNADDSKEIIQLLEERIKIINELLKLEEEDE